MRRVRVVRGATESQVSVVDGILRLMTLINGRRTREN